MIGNEVAVLKDIEMIIGSSIYINICSQFTSFCLTPCKTRKYSNPIAHIQTVL